MLSESQRLFRVNFFFFFSPLSIVLNLLICLFLCQSQCWRILTGLKHLFRGVSRGKCFINWLNKERAFVLNIRNYKSEHCFMPWEFISCVCRVGSWSTLINMVEIWKSWNREGNYLKRERIHIRPESKRGSISRPNLGDDPSFSNRPGVANAKRVELGSDELAGLEFFEGQLGILVDLSSYRRQPIEELGFFSWI